MSKFVSNVVMVILAVMLFSGCYIAGMLSVDQEVEQVVVSVDNDLLTAARVYHSLENDEIFYIGPTLVFRRDGHTCSVCTGAFLHWFHESYLKDGEGKYENKQ